MTVAVKDNERVGLAEDERVVEDERGGLAEDELVGTVEEERREDREVSVPVYLSDR